MIVELFAGAGGFSTGLRQTGHTGRAVGLEWNLDACRTATAAGHERICADVATYPVERFAGVDGLTGSPPCQAWSPAGKRLGLVDQPHIFAHLARVALAGEWSDYPTAGWADNRSPLVLEVVRWIDMLRPAWFACEQVEDVLPFWTAVARWARGKGYAAWSGVVSAEAFGVPQTRRRSILIGSLGSPVAPPAPTHQRYVPGESATERPDLFGGSLHPWVSMAEALGWEPSRRAVYVNGNRRNAARRSADQPAPTVMFSERSNKVDWVFDRPATTVCGDARIGRPGHKDRDRGEAQFESGSVRVTVQEAAILQGFPADYPWCGTKTARRRQVGDCIPPPLAAAILRPLVTVPVGCVA